MEAIKIHHETGLKYSDFLIFTTLDDEHYNDAFVDLLPNKNTIAIKRLPDRACYFFTKEGCSIPPLKPFVCACFPLWYDQEIYKKDHTITLIVEERDCLLREKLLEFTTLAEGCTFMHTSENEIKEIIKFSFTQYEMLIKFEHLFEKLDVDSAFEIIEKSIQT